VHNTSLTLKCTEHSVLSKQRALSTQCPSPSRHSVLSASIVCGMGIDIHEETQLLEQAKEKRKRGDQTPRPSHLNVVLSKASLSCPSVCLRARAPCPLRVSCPVTDRTQSTLLCAPPPGSRGRAAGLQACVLVAPWVKTNFVKRGWGHLLYKGWVTL
jgi:hypothetical protein